MKSDFDLIIHRLPECKEARLYIIGDLHVGAIEANVKGRCGRYIKTVW